jgi:3-dehydroquinate dehydratase type I
VSILPRTTTEALRLIEKAEESHADLIEVRLDCLKGHRELAEVATHGKTPKIATNKPHGSGGNFSGTETEQQQILFGAARDGFEYVDVELTNPKLKDTVTELKSLGVKPVVSFHDFAETLSLPGLNSVLKREIASGADVCKIVTTARRVEDNLTVLSFTSAACRRAKIVCFAMGELGRVSRLLSPLFGGYFAFASLERGGETAAGQMTVREMKAAYELLGLG